MQCCVRLIAYSFIYPILACDIGRYGSAPTAISPTDLKNVWLKLTCESILTDLPFFVTSFSFLTSDEMSDA